jgi:hypothetical protein
VDEVGEVFVRFYQQLLGTSQDTLPLNADVVRCGPCLDGASHVFLLAIVSNDDIKKALFNIGCKSREKSRLD